MTNNKSAMEQMVEWLEIRKKDYNNSRIDLTTADWKKELKHNIEGAYIDLWLSKARSLLAAEQSQTPTVEAGLVNGVRIWKEGDPLLNTPHAPNPPHSVVDDKGRDDDYALAKKQIEYESAHRPIEQESDNGGGHALTYCGDCSHYKKPSCAIFPKHMGESEGTYRGRFGCDCYTPADNKGNDKGLWEAINELANCRGRRVSTKELRDTLAKFREAK